MIQASFNVRNNFWGKKILPALNLYEYFARTVARDLTHTVLARLIKMEALTKLNFFSEAMAILVSLQRGEQLPHFIDDKCKNYTTFKNVSKLSIQIFAVF